MNALGLVTDQMTGGLRKCKEEESKSELSIRDASRTVSRDSPSCHMTFTAEYFATVLLKSNENDPE